MMYTNAVGTTNLASHRPVLRLGKAKNKPAGISPRGTKPGHKATATALNSKAWENPSISR